MPYIRAWKPPQQVLLFQIAFSKKNKPSFQAWLLIGQFIMKNDAQFSLRMKTFCFEMPNQCIIFLWDVTRVLFLKTFKFLFIYCFKFTVMRSECVTLRKWLWFLNPSFQSGIEGCGCSQNRVVWRELLLCECTFSGRGSISSIQKSGTCEFLRHGVPEKSQQFAFPFPLYSIFNIHDIQYSIAKIQYSILDIQYPLFNIIYPKFNIQY